MAGAVKGAVVGGGLFAPNHLNAWKDLEREGQGELVAVCDLDAAKAEAAKAKFGVPAAFTDPHALFHGAPFAFADVCPQMHTHKALVELAAGHGVAPIVQKP